MEELLEDYLNNTRESWSDKNSVYGWDINGHLCDIRYKESPEDYSTRTTQINIWDVMEYLYSQIKKEK